jgi:ABC-type multidrug transport system permease subunit
MLAGRPVVCSSSEVSVFDPPAGQTCGAYLEDYISAAGGTIQNPGATSDCQYCALTIADQFLAGSSIYYSERWR